MSDLIQRLRTQAAALALLANEIESGGQIKSAWLVAFDMTDVQKEVESLDKQQDYKGGNVA